MADPYEVDEKGRPLAEAEAAADAASPEVDPAAEALVRRQIEQTLRYMALSTLVGLLVIVILAVVLADERGVLILVGIVYLLTSLAARWYLRRTFAARLKASHPGAG